MRAVVLEFCVCADGRLCCDVFRLPSPRDSVASKPVLPANTPALELVPPNPAGFAITVQPPQPQPQVTSSPSYSTTSSAAVMGRPSMSTVQGGSPAPLLAPQPAVVNFPLAASAGPDQKHLPPAELNNPNQLSPEKGVNNSRVVCLCGRRSMYCGGGELLAGFGFSVTVICVCFDSE